MTEYEVHAREEGREYPDDLFFDTLADVVLGRATIADAQASIALCLELPGWEGLPRIARPYMEHMQHCEHCIVAHLRATLEQHPEMMAQLLANLVGRPVVLMERGREEAATGATPDWARGHVDPERMH